MNCGFYEWVKRQEGVILIGPYLFDTAMEMHLESAQRRSPRVLRTSSAGACVCTPDINWSLWK